MGAENFKKALMGYNKDDVKNFIENLVVDSKRTIKIKEDTIQSLQKRLNDSELQVSRLKEIENQYLKVQEKLEATTIDLDEKNVKIDILSLKVDELEDTLNQIPEATASNHLKEETLEIELERVSKSLLSITEEKDQIRMKYEDLKERMNSVETEALKYKEKYELLFDEHRTVLATNMESDIEKSELRAQLREIKISREEMDHNIGIYQEKLEALKEKEVFLEHEKLVIAHAILRAQEKADTMDQEFEVQYNIENKRFQKYKDEIEALRLKTVEVLNLFEGELNEILETKAPEMPLKSRVNKAESNEQQVEKDSSKGINIQLFKKG